MSRYHHSSAEHALNDFKEVLLKEYGVEAFKKNLIPKKAKEHLERLKRCGNKEIKR